MRQTLSRITTEEGRAFVPLALRGCGVGCKYCYISGPAAPSDPIPPVRFRQLLRSLTRSVHWRPGPAGPLLALGHDTEFAVSEALIDNVLTGLSFAREHRLPVQVATKFPLPAPVRSALDDWPGDLPTPVVFTTITTVLRSTQIEPGAPTPEERAGNFRRSGAGWLSYALVKPFLTLPPADLRALSDLLKRHRPDGAVVGLRYRPGSPDQRRRPQAALRRHPTAPAWLAAPLPRTAIEFVAELTRAGIRTFLTTRCVSAWHNLSAHGQLIQSKNPHLCVGCGACPSRDDPVRSGTAAPPESERVRNEAVT